MAKAEQGRLALVTGAAQRIGREIALSLGADGWVIAVHYGQSGDKAEAVVAEIEALGGTAAAFSADLRDRNAPQALVSEVAGAMGPLACLINNAALFLYDEARTLDMAVWDELMQVNMRAPVFLAQAFAAQLPDGGRGNIINIIDERVWKLVPTHFSYTLSKSALWTATRMLAQSYAPHIRVNGVGPGPTLQSSEQDAAQFARENANMLLGHGTSPQEIAAAIKFILASPAMTGQMIALDGGQHLLWQTPDMDGVELQPDTENRSSKEETP